MSRSQIYYYTLVQTDFTFAAQLFGGPASAWLPQPAVPGDAGEEIELRADGALPAPMATRLARVQVGEARRGAPAASGTLWRSLSWRAVASDQMFPVMEADLELAALDRNWCQLSLMGSYRPPLAVVGETGDRLFGRRVAEACTRRFVLDVADRFTFAGAPHSLRTPAV